jgi:hypothetical protein
MSARGNRAAAELSSNRLRAAPPPAAKNGGDSSFDSVTWTPSAPALLLFALVALVLAGRRLHLGLDDASYLDYFSSNTYWTSSKSSEDWNWWQFLIEEPLWNTYSAWLGEALGPEPAFRVTIFASVFLYLIAASRLSGGSYKLTLFLFALHPHIAMQMYFNQIRQGAGLAVFLTLVAFLKFRTWRRIGIAAAAASFIHSSFILVIATAASYVIKPWWRVPTALVVVVAVVIVAQYMNLFSMIDLGRREETYVATGAVNINFYIVTILTYGAIFYILAPARNNIHVSEWYFLTFLIATTAVAASSLHEAAARFVYLAETAICILIARNIRTQNGIIAFAVWLLAMAAVIISDYKYDATGQLGLFSKWQQVIFF